MIHGVDMSNKVIKIVKKLLEKSKFAKVLDNVSSIEYAMMKIPPKD